jgi:hypothetical protein
MPTVSFEGETHDEIVSKVRRWLASVEGEASASLSLTDVVEQSAELTKNALRIIAGAAPGSLAQSDVVKALTEMGYSATDATRRAVVEGLDSVERLTGGGVVQRLRDAGANVAYSMNAQVARSLLETIKRL